MSQNHSKNIENPINKKVFTAVLPLLFHLVEVDGKVTKEETELIGKFIKDLPKEGISEEEVVDFMNNKNSILENNSTTYIENAFKILDKDEQLDCLKVLILASLIDQEFDISEADLLLDVSEAFGFELEKVLADVTKA